MRYDDVVKGFELALSERDDIREALTEAVLSNRFILSVSYQVPGSTKYKNLTFTHNFNNADIDGVRVAINNNFNKIIGKETKNIEVAPNMIDKVDTDAEIKK